MEEKVVSRVRPMAKKNKVAERIAYTYQRKWVDGKFTHLVGRYDKYWCWFTGAGLACSFVYALFGLKDMIKGENKKDGF
eukprot:CAMPEP_0185848950 /NCGR_PEP_ID=MMETSP1354-20130828/3642_1 /TAXON_ID=708628 /ORGANISM="Erythrolobus madagascarensis, Strain CCMP3276" /LENGTH=78 /DNA_ID=CAMNT_0028549415 /DNA_START=113 /DNA_END=349 /DNA_ORIENTATION=+